MVRKSHELTDRELLIRIDERTISLPKDRARIARLEVFAIVVVVIACLTIPKLADLVAKFLFA